MFGLNEIEYLINKANMKDLLILEPRVPFLESNFIVTLGPFFWHEISFYATNQKLGPCERFISFFKGNGFNLMCAVGFL